MKTTISRPAVRETDLSTGWARLIFTEQNRMATNIENYRGRLAFCEKTFSNIFLPEKWSEFAKNGKAMGQARRFLIETQQLGNTIRLALASKNSGLRDELKQVQDNFAEAVLKFDEELSKPDHGEARGEAGAIAVSASSLASVIGNQAFDDALKSEAQDPTTSAYRKYPQDAEALALLEAAAKLKEKLAKGNPKIGDKSVMQALLDEPDVIETKQHKDQRLKYQARVWYGAVKNGQRKNATATPPERLDTKTRAAKWEKFYTSWGKYLSAFLLHPPAK